MQRRRRRPPRPPSAKRKVLPAEDEDSSSSDCEVYVPAKQAPDVIVISSDDSEEEEDSDSYSSDDEWADSKLNKGKKKIKVGKVSIEAFCVDVEDESALAPVKDEKPDAAGPVDENIRIKIRKMLQVGLHPGTPNEEAERSLRIAHSLLKSTTWRSWTGQRRRRGRQDEDDWRYESGRA